MDKPQFVYTAYIRTTPERLWQALTEPAFTRRGVADDVRHGLDGGSTDDLGQQRNHHRRPGADRPRVRSLPGDSRYTWHTFTPELNDRLQFGDELFAKLAGERRSRVAFDIEPVGDIVKPDSRAR